MKLLYIFSPTYIIALARISYRYRCVKRYCNYASTGIPLFGVIFAADMIGLILLILGIQTEEEFEGDNKLIQVEIICNYCF